MTEPQVLPYGAWPSPISLDMVIAGSRALFDPWLDERDIHVLESRPEEGGRVCLMRISPDGDVRDLTPAPANVRTRVHEYGGGAWAVHHGLVVHSEFTTGHLWRIDAAGARTSLCAVDGLRFADLRIDAPRGRVLAIQEDHRASDSDPDNRIVAVDLASGDITSLVSGHDFFSHPRPSPDGTRMCWLTWDRPNMPWDGSQLWVGAVEADGSIGTVELVAGGRTESICGPAWAPDGSLVFASDRSGWWNLHRWRAGTPALVPLAPMEAEFGEPQWVFGLRTTGFDDAGRVVAIARSRGRDRLLVLEDGHEPRALDIDATGLQGLSVEGGTAVMIATGPARPTALIRVDLATGAVERIREAGTLAVDARYLSQPRLVEFPTTGGRSAFAFHYPPTNPDVRAPDGELPPLIVVSHGGPTSNTDSRLDLGLQSFTSRGFAVIDVDYGGSSGYGRAYRDRLLGNWGIVDLDDCTNAALWLADQGLADRYRLAIRGGSAGGYTTLCALTFRDVFAAGASYFGVGDLAALARDTHKFESRYLDLMVAPWPAGAPVYEARSPIRHMDRMHTPVLLLQGADDKVVPQAQADEMAAALAANGVPHAYLLFQGEGHGFRRAEHQRRAREAELSFYAQVLGFTLADDIEPVEVTGLSR